MAGSDKLKTFPPIDAADYADVAALRAEDAKMIRDEAEREATID